MKYISLCLVMCLLISQTAKAQNVNERDEYGETIDEVYMRQDDANNANVITLDLSKTGSQVTYDIANDIDISARRKAVVIKGMELIRFTKYNMGSKAKNDRLSKPEYLDCSGFVQWTILRATGYDMGHGTAHQYSSNKKIEKEDLQIGDLGFKKPGGVQNLGGSNHVGIFVGYDKYGKRLWLHCTSGNQNGVNISNHEGSIYYVRPNCYEVN